MKTQEKTMRVRIRSFLTSFSVILIFMGTVGFLSYQSVGNRESSPGDKTSGGDEIQPRWQERAPRSLDNKDYDNYLQEDNKIFNNYGNVVVTGVYDKERQDENRRKSLLNSIASTATAKPATALHDIFISVKTTKKFHNTRLDIILKTWFNLAKEQTWFFTDTTDAEFQLKTGNHMVNTNCSSSHNRKALCCKMSREFDAFLESNKRWWCHFDDDNYVNIPALVSTLESYDPLQDWYLGRPSIRAPLEILNRDDLSKISFWFATGGAGFCLSRSLALKMMPIAGGGKFISVGEKIRLPDDVTMGYIIEHLLRKKLTIVEEFHSHLEPMRFINTETLPTQISFGYSQYGGSEMNVVPVEGLTDKVDPTRMLSLHCKLFPSSVYCPR